MHLILQLAETGFYYTGSESAPDATQCFMCGKDLDGWEKNDDPAYVESLLPFDYFISLLLLIFDMAALFSAQVMIFNK